MACVRRLSLVALLLALAGCGGGSKTAIKVDFVTDPSINSRADILAIADRLTLTVEGFDLNGGAVPQPPLQLVDVDGDGNNEVAIVENTATLSDLPRYRFLPGGQAPKFWIGAAAWSGATQVTVASQSLLSYQLGEEIQVDIPLNLRAPFRRLRVVDSLPPSGTVGVPAALGQIGLRFSREVRPSSVSHDTINVGFFRNGEFVTITGGVWEVSPTLVLAGAFTEVRSTAVFTLPCTLGLGQYLIEVSPGVLDTNGSPLDHTQLVPGDQGWTGSFTIGNPDIIGGDAAGCSVDIVECGSDDDCRIISDSLAFKCINDRCVIPKDGP